MLYINYPSPVRDQILVNKNRIAVPCLRIGNYRTSLCGDRLFIPTECVSDQYVAGFHPELTVRMTRESRPRIDIVHTDDMYMILSSRPGSEPAAFAATHGVTVGEILMPRGRQPDILYYSTNHKGDCIWDEVFLRAEIGDIFLRNLYTDRDIQLNEYYIVGQHNIFTTDEHTADAVYRRVHADLFPDRPAPDAVPWRWQSVIFGKHRQPKR